MTHLPIEVLYELTQLDAHRECVMCVMRHGSYVATNHQIMHRSLMDTAIPSRQAIQAKTASKPGRVTGALKVACYLIIREASLGSRLPYRELAAWL